jgi:hypothetical protein
MFIPSYTLLTNDQILLLLVSNEWTGRATHTHLELFDVKGDVELVGRNENRMAFPAH